MAQTPTPTPAGAPDPAPRRGLVLGGGGLLGAAWTVGALVALRDALGVEPVALDRIVGTSAGAILGGLIAAGVSVDDLRDHHRGLDVSTGPLAGTSWDTETLTGGRPPWPRPGPGSPRLVRQRLDRLRGLPPMVLMSAFLPEGRGSLAGVGSLLDAALPDGGWPEHPGLEVMALNYETGARASFSRADAAGVGLSDAVRASCAIPGYYAPVRIGGVRYVDGGSYSPTSADVLAAHRLDEVYVLAPMASTERMRDWPRRPLAQVESRWRRGVTRGLVAELAQLEAVGTRVVLLTPRLEDRAVIGANLMSPERRLEVLETSLRTSAAALGLPTDTRDPVTGDGAGG